MATIPAHLWPLHGLATGYAEAGAGAAIVITLFLLVLAGVFAWLGLELRPQAGWIAAVFSLFLAVPVLLWTVWLCWQPTASKDPDAVHIEQSLRTFSIIAAAGALLTSVAAIRGLLRKGKAVAPLRRLETLLAAAIVLLGGFFFLLFAMLFMQIVVPP